jgi:hypothetical protein
MDEMFVKKMVKKGILPLAGYDIQLVFLGCNACSLSPVLSLSCRHRWVAVCTVCFHSIFFPTVILKSMKGKGTLL